MSSVASPTRPTFNRWRFADQVHFEAERELLAWAMQHREKEEADAAFEEIQLDPRNVPKLIDSGEWQWLLMERDGDSNQDFHDRYLGTVYDR